MSFIKRPNLDWKTIMYKQIKRSIRLIIALVATCAFAESIAADTAKLNVDKTQLSVDARDGRLQFTVSTDKKSQLKLQDLQFNYQSAVSWTINSVSEQSIELVGRFAPSVEFYRTVDDNNGRQLTLTIRQVEGGFHLHAEPEWGRQVTLELEDKKDSIFGLSEALQPDNRLSPNLRDGVIFVDVNAEEASFQEN